jgi:outer membrane protein TolC
MDRAGLRFLTRLSRLRRRAQWLWAAGLFCVGACTPLAQTAVPAPERARAVAAESADLPEQRSDATPPPSQAQLEFRGALPATALPISLDTVLRLTQEQNLQIGLARLKVNAALADKDVADKNWLPDLYLGGSAYRHNGGIQNEDGTLTRSNFGTVFGGVEVSTHLDLRELAYQRFDAARKVWQQRGELSRATSDKLLEASTAYIELLAARSGEAISATMELEFEKLLEKARRAAAVDNAKEVEVLRVDMELRGQRKLTHKLRGQSAALAARLAYLLGVDPHAELVVIDRQLTTFDLVDVSVSVQDLVQRALQSGPGVRELEGLLALVQEAEERAQSLGRFLPVVEARVAEGAFGAGPGTSLTGDNRLDVFVQARWNLTAWYTRCERQRAAEARKAQVHLSYSDLRGKLTASVEEAVATIQSGKKQISEGEEQFRLARRAIDKSYYRYEQLPLQQRGTAREVLDALGALQRAQFDHVAALRDYDKAQLALFVLLGSGTASCSP